jgi:hypothetical protein
MVVQACNFSTQEAEAGGKKSTTVPVGRQTKKEGDWGGGETAQSGGVGV